MEELRRALRDGTSDAACLAMSETLDRVRGELPSHDMALLGILAVVRALPEGHRLRAQFVAKARECASR